MASMGRVANKTQHTKHNTHTAEHIHTAHNTTHTHTKQSTYTQHTAHNAQHRAARSFVVSSLSSAIQLTLVTPPRIRMLLERIEWSDLPTPDHVGAGAGVPDWRLAPDATENNLTPATYDYTNGGAAIRVHRGRKEVQEFAALLASPVATVGAKLRAVLVWLQWSPEALVKARNLTRPDDPATVAKRAKAKAKKLEASVASASTPGAFAGAPTPGASAPSPRSESESAAAVRERSNDRGRDRGRREREREGSVGCGLAGIFGGNFFKIKFTSRPPRTGLGRVLAT